MDRHCGSCNTTKPIDEFNWRRRDRGQRDNMCKDCRNAYRAAHYAANRQRYIDNAAARTRRTLEERTHLILDYFDAHPCVDCGENDPVVLEFDHLRDKKFGISSAIRGYRSLHAMLDEMTKCEVVCVNCHRRRTARRGGFLRALLAGERAAEVLDGAGDGN